MRRDRFGLGGGMDGEVVVGLLGSVLGGTVVAVVSLVANHSRAQAESRKIDAETDKIRAETALLVAKDSARIEQLPQSDSRLPAGWHEYGQYMGAYELGIDSATSYTGRASGTIRSITQGVRGFVTMMQSCHPGRYLDKRVKMSAFLRTRSVEQQAWLWMRVDGPNHDVLAFDNMSNRAVVGTTDWRRYEIVLDVPDTARAIAFGFAVSGDGQVWADAFCFEEVALDVASTNQWSTLGEGPTNLSFDLEW